MGIIIEDDPADIPRRHAGIVADLRDLADWLERHPGGPEIVITANCRVPAGARGLRVSCLRDIADYLGVDEREDGMGSLVAERRFGGIRLEGHVSHPDRSYSAYMGRAAGLRASIAATGGGATS
jgi:hypothetical protein